MYRREDETYLAENTKAQLMNSGPLMISPYGAVLGFSERRSGGMMARSMMLSELRELLSSTAPAASRQDYQAAIIDENILGKDTYSSRRKSATHLYELYGLDPRLALFRILRRLADEDRDSLPLLAVTCVYCRDAQLRASFPLIESLKPGEILERRRMEDHLENLFPRRFSIAMKRSLTQNINTTWTAAGHLSGVRIKRKARPIARPVASTYAMFAGYLSGLRGEALLASPFGHLVGADPLLIMTHLTIASRQGWLRFRQGGGVMEMDFSPMLLPEEEALLHGPV